MSKEIIVEVGFTPRHMVCMRCGKEITEAFYVSVRPKMSMDGDRKKIRGMCAWTVDLDLCDICTSRVLHEASNPERDLLEGMAVMKV